MADLERLVHDLITRVDAQEQRIANLEGRNEQLTQHNAALLSQIASPGAAVLHQPTGPEPASTSPMESA